MIKIREYIEKNYKEFNKIIKRQLGEQSDLKKSYTEDILHNVLMDILLRSEILEKKLKTEKELLGYIINCLNINSKSSSAPSRKLLKPYTIEENFIYDTNKNNYLDVFDTSTNDIELLEVKENQINLLFNYQSKFYIFDWIIYINSFFNSREEIVKTYGIYNDYYAIVKSYITYGIKFYAGIIKPTQLESECEKLILNKNKGFTILQKNKLFLFHNYLYKTNYCNIHKKEDFTIIYENLKNYFYN